MAAVQDNTGILELFSDEDAGGVYYCGTQAEFVGAGKFKPEWFLGAKRSRAASVTIEGDELRSCGFAPDIARVRIERNEEGRGLFDVALLYSDEDAARRSHLAAKEFEERAYSEGAELAKRWIDGMPSSVEEFKKNSAALINNMMTIFFNEGMAAKSGGYSFDKETVREFDLGVEALCGILLNGKVRFYQFGHEQARRELVMEAFNRGLCLSFTGHERNALVDRFLRELDASEAVALPG